MTHLTADMLADLTDPRAVEMRHKRTNAPFQRTSSLQSYASSGKAPLVDAPAWDPDDELVSGSLEDF